MNTFKSIPTLSVSLILLFFISCNQSDEQRKFEKEAFSIPENITETKNGIDIEGNEDPDDWRIGPYFQGVVFLDAIPFPNPLISDQRLNLNFTVTSVNSVSTFRILVSSVEGSLRFLDEFPTTSTTGLTSISLSAGDIARFSDNPEGLYRIIVEDRQGVIITYGDVRIE